MIHHRILVGFLNISLGNTVQKTSKRYLKCMLQVRRNLKPFLILKNGTKTCFCKSFFKQILLWKKTKNLQRTNTFALRPPPAQNNQFCIVPRCMYVYIYICMYVCMYVCMYIYVLSYPYQDPYLRLMKTYNLNNQNVTSKN